MKTRFLRCIAMLCFGMYACNTAEKENNHVAAALIDGHPAWILQGNIYEVNIRQYTPEGTFKAFEKHLPRLKEMGIQTLWFMPVHPISKVDRKGALGSYYAVSSYYQVNPEFGTLSDWKELVTHAQSMGFKVVMDYVPNHSGADHEWLTAHPDFYVKDSITGKALAPFDWSDVRELDYHQPALRDSMLESMKYWLRETGIDGFRIDVAWGVPDDFWHKSIAELRKLKPDLFMLAEADGPNFHKAGFDASYPWTIFHAMNKVASGERDVRHLDSALVAMDSSFPTNAIRLYFTSNHDENSWNKADYGTMPGKVHAPFAIFTQTYGRSVPLIYSGQEEPVTDSISFFYKDTIVFSKLARAAFYKTLLTLRKENPALAANVPAVRIPVGDAKHLFAYVRKASGKKLLVVLNLSPNPQQYQLDQPDTWGKAFDVFQQQWITLDNKPRELEPWGYGVYSFTP